MKVYISADIEGITGTTHWDETEKKHADYQEYREQMTAEVIAACEGAIKAGAQEVLVKDAHDSARNLIAEKLPPETRLMRGWSGHPYLMMDGLDESFQAVMMIGYHSRGGSSTSPLAHTMTGAADYVKINEHYASEFLINAYIAGLVQVPIVLVTGDAGLCEEATAMIPELSVVAVKQGIGSATVNLHPSLAVEKIRKAALEALSMDVTCCQIPMPKHFEVDIRYHQHTKAYGASFYPGARQIDPQTVRFTSDDYFSVLRFFSFVL